MAKLLYLCEFTTLNGGEQSLLSVLPAIIKAGHEVSLALPGEGPLATTLAQHGIPYFTWPELAGGELAARREQLTARLAALRPHLLHANSLAMSRLSGPVAQGLGMKSIGHLRDIVRLSAAAVRDLNGHTRLIAVSQATANAHFAQGLLAQKVLVLHNGVDLERFRPRTRSGKLHRELNLHSDAALLGAVGQIGMRKGLDVLLNAANRVFEIHRHAHLVIVGQRHSQKAEAVDYEQQLHAAASKFPLAGRVHFLGRCEAMPELYAELTLLVHAARQEPLGRVLLEGAAAGCPIIATDVGGTREIFPEDSQAALVIPPNDAVALAEATNGLLSDECRRSQLAATARGRMERAFDVHTAGAKLLHVYEQVLEGNE